jgi:hypothetical protein
VRYEPVPVKLRRLGAVLSWLPLGACTQSTTEVPAPPTVVHYQIVFPDTAAVVAADTIQVMIFDATYDSGACLALVTKRSALPSSPVLLAESDPTTPCDLLAASEAEGQDGGVAGREGTIAGVTYGSRSLLAVVQRAQADFFIGCAPADIAADTGVISISVLPVDPTIAVPPTACTTLADKCSGTCS